MPAPHAGPARRGEGAAPAPGRRRRTSGAGSCARRCRRPGCATPTWSRSTPPTRRTGCSTSRWSTSPGEDLAACWSGGPAGAGPDGAAAGARGRRARRGAPGQPRAPRHQAQQPDGHRRRHGGRERDAGRLRHQPALDADSEITRTGEIVGTIAYCAPEQLSRGRVDGACDQYALACVAYECLTGWVPFPREGQLAIMTAHLTAPPPSGHRGPAGPAGRGGRGAGPGHGQGPGRPLPDLHRVRGRARGRPADRPGEHRDSSRPRTRWRSGSGPGTTWCGRRGTRTRWRCGWAGGAAGPVVAPLVVRSRWPSGASRARPPAWCAGCWRRRWPATRPRDCLPGRRAGAGAGRELALGQLAAPRPARHPAAARAARRDDPPRPPPTWPGRSADGARRRPMPRRAWWPSWTPPAGPEPGEPVRGAGCIRVYLLPVGAVTSMSTAGCRGRIVGAG